MKILNEGIAYDNFAIRAFEVNAIDYLLKPYSKKRFLTTIEKVLSNVNNELSSTKSLLESLKSSITYPDTILVEYGNRLVSLNVNEIMWMGAFKDYTTIHTKEQAFVSGKGNHSKK